MRRLGILLLVIGGLGAGHSSHADEMCGSESGIRLSGSKDAPWTVQFHAAVTVSIPPGHQTGQLESPRFGKRSAAAHFVIRDRTYLDTNEAFIAAVNTQLSARGPDDRDVLLFVHGYNNAFEDSVFRFSQFAHDSGFAGVRVLFSWASRGSSLEYFYDRESATIARDGLERTLRLLAGTKARKVHIMVAGGGDVVGGRSEAGDDQSVPAVFKQTQDRVAAIEGRAHMAVPPSTNTLAPMSFCDRSTAMDWPEVVALLNANCKKLTDFIEALSEQDLYGGPMRGANNAWTPGRWAEAAGPSHFRSASKFLRSALKSDA